MRGNLESHDRFKFSSVLFSRSKLFSNIFRMTVLSIILSIMIIIQAMPVSIEEIAAKQVGEVVSKLSSQEKFGLLKSAISEKTEQIDIATSEVSTARLEYENALLDAKERELKSYEHIGHDSFGVVALNEEDEKERIVKSGLSKSKAHGGDRNNMHDPVAIAYQKYQKILKDLEALEGEHDRLANAMIEIIG